MGETLQQYFPVIRDRKTVLNEVQSRNDLKELFDNWEEKYQEQFLDICIGVRGEKGKKFKYQNIKKVYTIVFLEKSSKEFHEFQSDYLHRGKQTFDTGLQLELLQEYVFIALDIFHRTYQKSTLDNSDITYQNKSSSKRTRLEAWLTFLSDDNPEEILRLLEEYPEFKKFYEEVYEMCRNMERFMELFSKELAELDKMQQQ